VVIFRIEGVEKGGGMIEVKSNVRATDADTQITVYCTFYRSEGTVLLDDWNQCINYVPVKYKPAPWNNNEHYKQEIPKVYLTRISH